MTAISYHDRVKELQGLDWACDGPFGRALWFELLEDVPHKPLYALAKTDANRAICLPLAQRENGLHSLTNWYAFTWQGLQTAPAPEDVALHDLARSLARRVGRIELEKLSEAHRDAYAQAFRKSGWLVFASQQDSNHILPVNGRTYADYLAGRPGQLRTTLKRKAKKVEVTLATQFSGADWDAYEAIYADSWKPEEGDPALLRRFAESESAAGRYRFALARHEGEPVAAQFWTVDTGTAYIHKLAHRPAAEKLSPGTTLTAALMEHVIDTDKVTLIDFGTGDDRYKRDWMEDMRLRWRLTCLRPENRRNWPLIGKMLLRRGVSKLVSRSLSG